MERSHRDQLAEMAKERRESLRKRPDGTRGARGTVVERKKRTKAIGVPKPDALGVPAGSVLVSVIVTTCLRAEMVKFNTTDDSDVGR